MPTSPTPRRGIWVANLTPFRRGAVDTDLLAEHARWLIANGARGLSPTGAAGEFLYLTRAEKRAIYETITPVSSARAALWPGVWEPHEESILETVRWLAPHDVAGIIVPPPLYYRFSEEELVWYYRRLADASALPIMAEDRPRQTNNPLGDEVLRALVVEGLIVGVVEASGDVRRLDRLLELFGGQLDVFGAGDGAVRQARAQGATGFISALGNVFPELVRQAWDRADAEAQALIDRVRETLDRCGLETGLKYLLLRRGFRFGTRPPFGRLSPPQQQALDAAFQIVESEGFAEAVRLR